MDIEYIPIISAYIKDNMKRWVGEGMTIDVRGWIG
jgi:hypothetical protein